jgi:hypothetical protein
MKRILLGTLAAAAVSIMTLTAAAAQSDQKPSREERMQHWAADHETMLHAKLAGMKAGLGLRADQENLWTAFESSINDAFKSHMETMQKMMKMREDGERVSPVDRMEFMAGRMAQGAGELKRISEATKPLYASLDDKQKRNFELLGRGMMMTGRRPPTVEGEFEAGDAGFSWVPYGWSGMME